ncbi:hypothetical protein VE03_10478 [Pseudogymnoascus sp. 23342-1-I1]|nr:hypothetical protein VE03_10478 [Pseudogymnoascus sp. 23342-1-I1]
MMVRNGASPEVVGRNFANANTAESPLEKETSPITQVPSSFGQITFNGFVRSNTTRITSRPDGSTQVIAAGHHPIIASNVSAGKGSSQFIGTSEAALLEFLRSRRG